MQKTRSHVASRPWLFRPILCFSHVSAIVFSHLPFATSFLDTAGRRTLSANFGKFHFEVCLGGQVVAPDPSIEVSER